MSQEAGPRRSSAPEVADDDLFSPFNPPKPPREETGPERELGLLRHWERLRIAYNASLTVEVILLLLGPARPASSRPDLLFTLLAYCVAANVCFCAGPVAAAYLHWMGARGPIASYLLFALGTLLAIMLTGLVMLFLSLGFIPQPGGADGVD